MGLDPVTLAVIQSRLRQVATEMDVVHQKAAFSPVISEAFDRSNGIYDLHTGRMVAQGETGLPLFIGVMQATVKQIIERGTHLDPGDVIVMNDPYLGGTHLMDMKMIRPYYHDGRLWCYLANTGHWPDVGGSVPGGYGPGVTEIQQEGLRLPPVRLYKGDEIDEEMLAIILNNIRIPDERVGDIRAQVAALQVGERRLDELLAKYGADTVEAAMKELHGRAEQQIRARIAEVPNGTYSYSAYVDSDGFKAEPVEVNVEVTVEDADITFDFGRSSAPCAGPVNCPFATTEAAVFLTVQHIFPDLPINGGCFEALHVKRPVGTFLDARYPRPVSGCAAEVSQRVVEVVIGAFAEAIPDRMFAPPAGTSGNLGIGGYDAEAGSSYVMYVFSGGGLGGWWQGDGITNGCPAVGISKIQPVEVLEQRYPVIFDEYSLREGSAGDGKYRGGYGIRYRLRLLTGTGRVSFMMDHGVTGPGGIAGGGPGGMNRVELTIDGNQVVPEHVSKGEGFLLSAGDWITVETPGGGGYGDPAERDPALVERDFSMGYVVAAEA